MLDSEIAAAEVVKTTKKRKHADTAAPPDPDFPFVAAMKSHRPFGI